MKLSELIKTLSANEEQYGNCEVIVLYDNGHSYLDVTQVAGVGIFPSMPKEQVFMLEGSK